MSDQILKIERLFDSPQQVVFDSWTSPDALKQWHCGTIAETTMELKIGGQFLIRFEPEPEGTCDHMLVRGKYLEIENPSLLKYTWKWDGSDMEESIVTVKFESKGPESTLMRVIHEKLDTQKSRDDHSMGWNECVNGLGEFLKSANVAD